MQKRWCPLFWVAISWNKYPNQTTNYYVTVNESETFATKVFSYQFLVLCCTKRITFLCVA